MRWGARYAKKIVVGIFVTRKDKVFKVQLGWIKNEVGEGSVIPRNAIALGAEHEMKIF